MKRKSIALVVTFLIVLGVWLPANVVHADDSDEVYVALGDSLAFGIGATDPATTGYVPLFFEFLEDEGDVEVLTNLSVPAETSGSMISGGQLAAAVATIADPDNDAEVVTLDIGGNDLLGLLGTPPCAVNPGGAACQSAIASALNTFAGNYSVIVGTLAVALGNDVDETLFVMTYYNPFSGTGSPLEPLTEVALLGVDGTIDCAAASNSPANAGLNDLIACIGASAGATVVDVKPSFDGNAVALTHIAVGDIHPNDAGHTVIAGLFVESFEGDDEDDDDEDEDRGDDDEDSDDDD